MQGANSVTQNHMVSGGDGGLIMDKSKIEEGVRLILEGIGENINRPGLLETPSRVAKMFQECLAYTGKTNKEIATEFGKCFDEDSSEINEIVVVKDIPAFSWCEHHMALMYDMMVTVEYIPNGKVIGLSKISRIVDAVTRRLQLQERIGRDLVDVLRLSTGSEDIRVTIEAKHSCVTARGIKKDATTRTVTAVGRLKGNLV